MLSAFINCWRFASKEQSALLEGYFTLLASVNAFDPILKPFLKLIATHTGFRPVKWYFSILLITLRTYRLFRMCCIVFSEEIPELSQEVLRTKVLSILLARPLGPVAGRDCRAERSPVHNWYSLYAE